MPSTPPMTLVLKTTVHPHNSPPAKAEPMAVPLKDGERVSILFGRMRPHLPDDDDDNDEEVRTDEGLCLPAAGRNKEAEEEEEEEEATRKNERTRKIAAFTFTYADTGKARIMQENKHRNT
mmetsp:Transcript_15810/g.34352  ORF Transcript_15810/g.34352 Transcript_15810/m.34352 type:complete len:121 (+) Transcript_15810:1229-1591(+)